MSGAEPVLQNISDTARWAAVFRALETERPDALFRDPHAARLAGERGEQIAAAFPFHNEQAWSWVTRTRLFDDLIAQQIQCGADMVVNLAAGLDARPYRMAVPTSLQWFEVDLPEIVHYKKEALANERPQCRLGCIPLDLANRSARKALFADLSTKPNHAVVITEGLLTYLTEEACGELADDLAAVNAFHDWVLDLSSPGLLKMLQEQGGAQLDKAGAPLRFAPPNGPQFFTSHGWAVAEVHSLLKTAARLGRVPEPLKQAATFPEPPPDQMGDIPWSGVCLLKRS